MPPKESDPLDVLSGLAAASAEAIADFVAQIPAERFQQAVRMIDSARSIAVAGQHNASAVAACLGDGLCQIGYRCRHLAALDREDRRHVSGMGTGDLLITINLGAEPGPLTDLVSVAQGRGVRVLAIGLSPEDFGVRENDLALVMATTVRGSVQPLVPPFVFAQSLLMVLSDS